jgi:hypothetical protein
MLDRRDLAHSNPLGAVAGQDRIASFVGIDPGQKYTAVAVLPQEGEASVKIIHATKKSWREVAEAAELAVRNNSRVGTVHVYIEEACLRGGAKGQNTAKGAMGNRAIGEYLHGWFEKAGFEVTMVSPVEWKSNTPKEITQARLERDHRDVYLLHKNSPGFADAMDALGIAVWAKKSYLKESSQ